MYAASAQPAWHRTRAALYLSLLILATLALFAAIRISHRHEGTLNNLSEAAFLVLKGSAALLGLWQLRRFWHAATVPLRCFAIAICSALAISACGELAWLVYNLLGVAVPYPSLADVFYLGGYCCWIVGLSFLFWALDTNVRDEVGPFIDILGVTWSLIIVVLTLLGVSPESVGNLLKLILDIVYPFFSALACALLGSLILGPQLRRLSPSWRWFIIALYCAWLLTFIADIGFSITTSLGRRSLSFELLYYDGGPIDAVYAAADLLLCCALAFAPLGTRLRAEPEASELAEIGVPAALPPR